MTKRIASGYFSMTTLCSSVVLENAVSETEMDAGLQIALEWDENVNTKLIREASRLKIE